MENKFIALTIMLFVLSTVSERISNLFKLYLPEGLWVFRRIGLINGLRYKYKEIRLEKRRERAIQLIALICGLLIAFVWGIDMVALLTLENKDEALGNFIGYDFLGQKIWRGDDKELKFILVARSMVGIILTGVFLSFGSKFWHDLLGVLFYSKAVRKNLSRQELYEAGTVKEVEEWSTFSNQSKVKLLLAQNRDDWLKIEGVVAVGMGKDIQGNPQIEIRHTTAKPPKIKEQSYNDPSGSIIRVPIKFVKSRPIVAQNLIEPSKIVASIDNINVHGRIGGMVEDETSKEKYFMTCYHVIRTRDEVYARSPKSYEKKTKVVMGTEKGQIGEVFSACRNDYVDVALIKPRADWKTTDEIPGILGPCGTYKLTDNDINKTYGYFKLYLGDRRMGIVTMREVNVEITYTDQKEKSVHKLYDLIEISTMKSKNVEEKISSEILGDKNDKRAFSYPGDSGSWVMNGRGEVIGMLVAGDGVDFSYVIPIHKLLNTFQSENFNLNPLTLEVPCKREKFSIS